MKNKKKYTIISEKWLRKKYLSDWLEKYICKKSLKTCIVESGHFLSGSNSLIYF